MKHCLIVGMAAMISVVTFSGCNKDDGGQSVPEVSGVKMNTSIRGVLKGNSIFVSYEVIPEEAIPEDVKWSTSDETIATVDETYGIVTGIKAGIADIHVVVNGKFCDTCTVLVLEAAPEYPEAPDSACVNINGIWWAPVNCGYANGLYPMGLLYQWGRGSGLTYDEDPIPTIAKQFTGVNGTEDKNTFYKGRDGIIYGVDWISTRNDKYWNSGTDEEPVRTQFDPCPEGWRVPTFSEVMDLIELRSEWTALQSGQKGYYFSGKTPKNDDTPSVFFPAAGERSYGSGKARFRNKSCGYWSSSANGSESRIMIFDSTHVLDNSYQRSGAHPVRCVKVLE